jgi:Fe-S cluster assembly protein SufD
MVTATKQLGNYLESFGEFQTLERRDAPGWLNKLREDAFARFCETGFPTVHDEDWRFTNLSAVARTPFRRAARSGFAISQQDLEQFRFADSACQLVFVNGHFAPELSRIGSLPSGLEVSSLSKKIEKDPESVKLHLGRYLDTRRDAFWALNTAFLAEGAYVRIQRRVILEQPIHLLYISVGDESPLMNHPRNLIIAEQASQAGIIEDYVSLGREDGAAFCNTVTELIAEDDAVVSHYLIERENWKSFNVSTLRIQQGRGANVSSHSILLGGGLVRNNVHPVLAGEGAECLINGLFIGGEHQHLDNYMLVEHASPHCGSRQFYNGILDGQARGVFHGRIIVHKDAQKTDAKQTNRNLLLSDDARIDTKPQLEIYADDVKCTHGATIGQIDEEALFYLRSRGIDEVSARKLLLYAFASECLDRMKQPPVRSFIEGLLSQQLTHMAQSADAVSGRQRDETPQNWEEVG